MAKQVTLTNTEVSNSLEAIQTLLVTSQTLPIGLSTACYDNMERLSEHEEEEVESYRQELIEEHAEHDENGDVKTVESDEDDGETGSEIKFKSEEDRQEFVDKLSDRYDQKNTLEVETVPRSLAEEVEAPPQVIPALRWMLVKE